MCCTSTWPVNKQVLAFTLFVCNSSHPVYDDCSMKKQPISTAVVLEFRELLKWITKWYWNLSELYECKHICHRDRFIFYITLWVFHNASKSKKKEFICSAVLQTVFVLFASQLTAALPFSMRTSSYVLFMKGCCVDSSSVKQKNVYHRWITKNFPCKWHRTASTASGCKFSPRKIFHWNSSGERRLKAASASGSKKTTAKQREHRLAQRRQCRPQHVQRQWQNTTITL